MRPERAINILIALLILFSALKLWNRPEQRISLIQTDGVGYYSFLPAIFIYHDLQFQFLPNLERKYWPNQEPIFKTIDPINGKMNKYFCGVTLLMLPFFLLAHALAIIGGFDADGLSAVYRISIAFGALIYLLIGLRFLVVLMRKLSIGPTAIGGSLVLIVLGTNLFAYSVLEPSMSHVYSFFAASAFMLFTHRAIEKSKLTVAMSLALALVILIRPTNAIIVLLIPFLAESWAKFKLWLRAVFSNPKQIVTPIILGFLALSIQLVLYKLQTGNWIVWSYGGEGFNFKNPQFFNVLFSYRKGWFVYTPLALLALFGVFHFLKRSWTAALSLVVYFSFTTYLIASWWMWYYGGSFGHRAFIDSYPVIAILLGLLLNSKSKLISTSVVVVSFGIFLPLNLFQTYQYRVGILHPDQMDENSYLAIFLQTNEQLVGLFPLHFPAFNTKDQTCVSFPLNGKQGIPSNLLSTEISYSGGMAAYISDQEEYGPAFEKPLLQFGLDSANSIQINSWLYSVEKRTNAVMVLTVTDSANEVIDWQGFPMSALILTHNKWEEGEVTFRFPTIYRPLDMVKVYLLRPKGPALYYDEMKICLSYTETR